MKNIVRIVAAVVDTRHLILYKETGETLLIPQGDPRIRRILDEATPNLISQGFADVDVTPETDNPYMEFEEQSNGVVKLFRISKKKLIALLSAVGEEVAPAAPTVIGTVPTPVQATLSAVEEIMQHAVSVTSPDFREDGIAKQGDIVEEEGHTIKAHSEGSEPDTVIAVMDGKIIPGMEKIKTQFSRATKLGSTTGIENFLRRLGSVINERSHSVEDLLKFMERGDLPIADDGSILIYKVLNRKGDKYVDCHSKKVEQFIGAYVCMDPSLVDHNRSNECSNGLHVARRGYVKEFSGDVCVLAKLAPEDVIAVPSYDANKMRVCGYHIIAELSQEQYSLVKQNKPITDVLDGRNLLGMALAGLHIGKTHEVRITGHMGSGVKVTELSVLSKPKPVTKAEAPVAEALTNPSAETKDQPIDPKDVIKQVEKLSGKALAAKLYADYQANQPGSLEALLSFKKASKVSWERLGIPAPAEWPTVCVGDQQVPVEIVIKEPKRNINDVMLGEGSSRERIQKLLAIGLTSVGVAQAILTLKKQSKKSWGILGVSEEQVEDIMKLAQ